ncbi:MAG: RQC domain-containing protein [Planctomycetota bacterium]|jgi:ATP-dependent DNA helicase RecQ
MLYSPADVLRWQGLMESSGDASPENLEAQSELLDHMQRYARNLACRHKQLVEYFGQPWTGDDCRACDVCLGEVKGMAGSTEIAQKIISCVARVGQRFGVGHVVQVLRGSTNEQVARQGHEQLSTHGLLRELPEKTVQSFVYQLVDHGHLERSGGDRPVLTLTETSVGVLRGERTVELREPPTSRSRARSQSDTASWEGVDRSLFEHLRDLRRRIAAERGGPAYIVFDDRTLRSLATLKPTTIDAMRHVHGVGEKKLADYGETFVEAIAAYESNASAGID